MNTDDKIILRFQNCHTRTRFREGRLQRVSRLFCRRGFVPAKAGIKDCGNDIVMADLDSNDGEYNLTEPVYTPLGQRIRMYVSGGIAIMGNKITEDSSSIITKR